MTTSPNTPVREGKRNKKITNNKLSQNHRDSEKLVRKLTPSAPVCPDKPGGRVVRLLDDEPIYANLRRAAHASVDHASAPRYITPPATSVRRYHILRERHVRRHQKFQELPSTQPLTESFELSRFIFDFHHQPIETRYVPCLCPTMRAAGSDPECLDFLELAFPRLCAKQSNGHREYYSSSRFLARPLRARPPRTK